MKYSDYRNKIQKGDVLAWSHKGLHSWYDFKVQVVRAVTRSEYSHVGFAWPIAGRVFILEAVMPKIRIYPLSKELPFYHVPLGGDWWTDEIEETALGLIGDCYSQTDAIKAFLGMSSVGANNVWQCAEYVAYLLIKGGLILNSDLNYPDPSNVVEALQQTGRPIYLIQKEI